MGKALEPSVLGLASDATSRPDRIALIGDGFAVKYLELSERVASWTVELAQRGVGRGTRVVLGTERSVGQIVALLALLDLGAVVCPVDLTRSPGRRDRVLRALEPRLILSGSEAWLARRRDASSYQPPESRAAPSGSELAYIAHTSGGTGTPKAVAVPRGALQARIEWAQGAYPLEAADVVLYASTLTFDSSFWEILGPLCSGAAVVILPEGAESEPDATAQTIQQTNVTVAHFVPFVLADLFAHGLAKRLHGLRLVMCSGERLPYELAKLVLETLDVRLLNQYGSTETCSDVLTGELTLEDLVAGEVHIGRPMTGVTARVLDEKGLPVNDGEPGTLHIGGDCLASGYLNDGGRTAEAFVPDAWSARPGSRLYNTGDRVRRTPSGTFMFLGRSDDQVKVRGVRLDLGGIASVLETHPSVTEAHVTRVTREKSHELVAHIAAGSRGPSDAELGAFVADELASAAVPDRFIRHSHLPRQRSGKLDLTALAAVTPPNNGRPMLGSSQAESTSAAGEAPASPEEEQIAAIWTAVLGHTTIVRSSDFFELGGESLLAMRMTARVRHMLGISLPVRTVFDFPTLADFARAVKVAHRVSA